MKKRNEIKKVKTEIDVNKDYTYLQHKSFYMFVHASGNVSVSVHKASDTKIEKWKTEKREDGTSYRYKKINVLSDSGERFELIIYESEVKK